MGFLEYINRYKASRPRLRRKSTVRVSTNALVVVTLLYWIPTFIILNLFIPIELVQQTTANPTSPGRWPTFTLGSQIDNIITDDRDGSIFVPVDGDVYKFSSNLTLLSSTISSSQPATTPQLNNVTSQFVNKIFKIIRFNNPDLLLSCWQNRNLTLRCVFYRLDDLKFVPLTWSRSSKNLAFKSDSNERLQVLPDKDDVNNLLIVASRPTASDNQLEQVISLSGDNLSPLSIFNMPALGRFKIIKVTKQLSLELITVLPYRTRLHNYNPLYDYIYMFNFEGYTHFILDDIQRPSPAVAAGIEKEPRHSARLARVCRNDTELNSYTEISITCNNQADLYAKVAYLDTSKSTTEPTLYVIFETFRDDASASSQPPSASKRQPATKSYLCSYSMKLIQDVFHKAIRDCHDGHPDSFMLAKLHAGSDQAPICQRNPTRDWCTSATNPYIDGYSERYNVKEDTFIELQGLSGANFFHSTVQGGGSGSDAKEVYFIGTESGLLTKLGSDEDLLYTIDIYSHRVRNYQVEGEKFASIFSDESIASRRGTRYAIGSMGTIAAATNLGEIHQLPIDGCQFYTTCRSCLTTRDPLQCVWCEDKCSNRNTCEPDKESTSSCPPLIEDFSPHSGPLTGGTRLTILGESFGSSRAKLDVRVGDQECSIDRATTSSERIECLVRRVIEPMNATVHIRVHDDSGYISLTGQTGSKVPYEYKKVGIHGVSPSSGPRGGGAEVSVYGENVDVGANRSIYFGDTQCRVLRVEAGRIRCKTEPLNLSSAGTTAATATTWASTHQEDGALITTQPLKVFIDGSVQNFTNMSSIDLLNLATFYQFRDDLKPDNTATDLAADHSHQDSDDDPFNLGNLFAALMLITMVLVIMIYLTRYEGFAQLRKKMVVPRKYAKNGDGKSPADLEVSFRNPQSHKFINSNPNARPGAESLNGLIKLNGSIMSSDYFGKSEQLEQDKPLMHNFLDLEMMSILAQEKILIDRNRLTLGHVLGSGQFGRVYKGFLKVEETGEHAAVAVKTLHNRCHWDDTTDNRAFLEEGLMMKDFAHENVLALIGVTFDSNGLPMVITPFMLYGDLRSYISDEASSPTVKELIEFGIQVASGMAYLSNLKFVHRDLAARNCMLDENLVVKVADFGLSRDIYERDYYSSDNKKAKLPVKWMAIESLEKSVYSTKTDVWSYGVLLWELMTRGVVPYPDVDNFDLFSYLKEGRRMLRPRYCPVSLYKIMQACWSANPQERPTFNELLVSVPNVITQLQEAKEDGGSQKVCRDETYCDVLG